jgi:hypothetical protein
MAFTFIKTGEASVKAAQKEAQEVQHKKAQMGKLFRFYMKAGQDGRITFIDGDLGPDGYLVPPRWYEHMYNLGGTWTPFVCPQKNAPDEGDTCPICELGNYPSLVTGFTIIDHTPYTTPKQVTYVDQRKLLIAKPTSFELLNKLAMKREGLEGCTFDVSRAKADSPSIGDLFDFVIKTPIKELREKYQEEVTDPKTGLKSKETYFLPVSFQDELVGMSGDELRALGIGSKSTVSGFGGSKAASTSDKGKYSSQL